MAGADDAQHFQGIKFYLLLSRACLPVWSTYVVDLGLLNWMWIDFTQAGPYLTQQQAMVVGANYVLVRAEGSVPAGGPTVFDPGDEFNPDHFGLATGL